MPRVTHFDIYATDPDATIAFYEGAFDWTIEKWDGPMDYWMVMTGDEDEPGIDGGISHREGPVPDADAPFVGFQCTMEVTDLDESLARVAEHGGTVVQEKGAIPGVGWFAACADPDGNQFGLMEADESATSESMAAGEPTA
jgi:predicted enzyme related to lactoylglutathione lyase